MPKFGEKLQIFIFGLSVGLLAACLFFIFKLDDYFRKIDFSALSQKKNVSEVVVVPKTEKENAGTDKKSGPIKEKVIEKNNNKPLFAVNDITDSSYAASETYRVLREELVSVKNIYVKVLSPVERPSTSDSLIASLAGVTTPDAKEFFMIEFWKTPLNSKGYKMTRSRLLIYGYPENPDVAIIKLADNYYLRNNNFIYKLSYSAEFKPLERTTESDIAGKFN